MTATQRWAIGVAVAGGISLATWAGSGAWSLAQAQGAQDATLTAHSKALDRIERKIDRLSERVGGTVADLPVQRIVARAP